MRTSRVAFTCQAVRQRARDALVVAPTLDSEQLHSLFLVRLATRGSEMHPWQRHTARQLSAADRLEADPVTPETEMGKMTPCLPYAEFILSC